MSVYLHSPQWKVAILLALPAMAFAAYVAWLVVPEVLRVVVPAVVETVTGQ